MFYIMCFRVGYFWSKKHCEEDTNDGIENTTVPCCLCVDPQKVCIVETAEEWDLVWPYLKEAKVSAYLSIRPYSRKHKPSLRLNFCIQIQQV